MSHARLTGIKDPVANMIRDLIDEVALRLVMAPVVMALVLIATG